MNELPFLNAFAANKVHSAFYFAPLENLASIAMNGILSHNEVSRRGIVHRDVSNPGAQYHRENRRITVTRLADFSNSICALHDLVPLYFNPSNAMLYKLIVDKKPVCIIELSLERLFQSIETFAFSDGNLASNDSKTYCDVNSVAALPWSDIQSESWNDDDHQRKQEKKYKTCAELIVSPIAQANSIVKVWVAGPESAEFAHEQLRIAGATVNGIEPSTDRFFGESKSADIEQAVRWLDSLDVNSLITESALGFAVGGFYSSDGECSCTPGLSQTINSPCAYCDEPVLRTTRSPSHFEALRKTAFRSEPDF